ncbi:MAG: metallophosphoesterase [Gammaproteobacteria bacterium]|nr:metallophosphoesterase [Gammaproteobacteria bacterium]
MKLVDSLFDGPLDIVGDIHGEIDALRQLLAGLGYDEAGNHPDGRRLVFVGDLVDRGPDSPAVLRAVRDLVNNGNAQCILGNHELNLLRDDEKHGNSWWTAPEKETEHEVARIDDVEKTAMRDWLETLPLVLERDDLRVVHACWNDAAVETLRALNGPDYRVADLYDEYQRALYDEMAELRFMNQVRKEWAQFMPKLEDPDWDAKFMPFKAELDRRSQMDNPISVVTSGEEETADKPFWAGGRWRMVSRVKWWERYDDEQAVVFGHYWRRFKDAAIILSDKYGPDLFDGVEPHHWMGQRNNVYCVDFSVGARASQRAAGESEQVCSLAAVRWPEGEVVHDDGRRFMLEDT